ncbi:MAG: glycosyltransferase family 2 protein [Lachnospiraceae bacterium]|jgi:glycosyltransferase involved in cell wall biosynthesis|nr:glycosyltransferase family 2 protein [Lachnospiraceae bacterium]RKJ48849.1 glycosyltransferase family 2 protein [bacterium 1XD42-54]
MKILSVAIPCYNSESYMEKCIKSMLPLGEDVEILIVDDGSQKDRTPQIADSYAAKYPGIIKAVHQENGGHGEAVNTGLRNATGLYYKVVDSDDWVNTKALEKIIERLKVLELEGGVDMLLANFVYDKVGVHHKKLMRFANVFPRDEVFEWDAMRHMRQTQYILMHNIIYRTQLLKDCGLVLPKHTFYVDNIFAFQPLPYVKRLYYMDVNLYHYFIGRDDQSVNEKVMIGRIDQQIRVNKMMIDVITAEDFSDKSSQLKKYMTIYLTKIMTVTSIMLILSGTSEALEKKKEVWDYLRSKDEALYKEIHASLLGVVMNLPGWLGRKCSIGAYKIAQKFVGFN